MWCVEKTGKHKVLSDSDKDWIVISKIAGFVEYSRYAVVITYQNVTKDQYSKYSERDIGAQGWLMHVRVMARTSFQIIHKSYCKSGKIQCWPLKKICYNKPCITVAGQGAHADPCPLLKVPTTDIRPGLWSDICFAYLRKRWNYGKKASQWRQRDALWKVPLGSLEGLQSCECYFDTNHLNIAPCKIARSCDLKDLLLM